VSFAGAAFTAATNRQLRMKVETFDGDTRALSRLAMEWPFKPYRWAPVSTDAVHALSLSRIEQGIARDGARTWVVRRSGTLNGLAMLEPLPWDSRMLRRSAARADFVVTGGYESRRQTFDALLETVSSESRRAGFEHLSVRVDAGDDAAIHALESAGFLCVDALLTFERMVRPDVRPDTIHESIEGLTFRDVRAEDVTTVEALAGSSFVDGRFHADPAIDPEVAAGVYREWAASCCRGTAADGVIVASMASGEIVGFVACRIHADTGVHLRRLTGSIVLIATAAAARCRGVGRAIVMAALGWASERSVVAMQVGTQIRNTAAARLYERCGFRLAAGSQSFRAVIAR
jgi:ribosomal protein S18 acetylase RimI-like enzyme